jgi:hypothetical protein
MVSDHSDESVGLNPGGIAEIFHVNDPDETIFLRHRKVCRGVPWCMALSRRL